MKKEEAYLLLEAFNKNFDKSKKYLLDHLVMVGRSSLIFHPNFHNFVINSNILYFIAEDFDIFNRLQQVLSRYTDLSYNSSYGLHYHISFTHMNDEKFTVIVMAPTLADGVVLTDYMRRAAHPLAPGAGISFKCLKPELVMKHWFKH